MQVQHHSMLKTSSSLKHSFKLFDSSTHANLSTCWIAARTFVQELFLHCLDIIYVKLLQMSRARVVYEPKRENEPLTLCSFVSARNVSRILWRKWKKKILNSFCKLIFLLLLISKCFFSYKPLSSKSSVVAWIEWVWREQDEQPRLATPHTTQ